MSRSMGSIFAVAEWITRFAYLNLLWIAFSLLGLVVFGFFPATVAMFTIIRKWMMGNSDVAIFSTFWGTFKKEFIKSNLVGLIVALIIGVIIVNLMFMDVNRGNYLNFTHIPLYLFMFAFLFTFLYLFPVYVHYDIKLLHIFKNAFLIMLINPINNLLIIIGVVTTYFVLSYIPGLLFFFGGSLMAAIILWPCYRAFEKIAEKKEANS